MHCPQHAVSLHVISPQLPSSAMHNSAAIHVQHAQHSMHCLHSIQQQLCAAHTAVSASRIPSICYQLHLQPGVTWLCCTVTLVYLMQVRVTGAQYGKWGKQKYGLKPQKLDALDFYPDRLRELWRAMQEEQVSPALSSQPLPCASCWLQCGHVTKLSYCMIQLASRRTSRMFHASVSHLG